MTSPISEERPLEILLVEDNTGDARLVEAHLEDGLNAEFALRRVTRLEEAARQLDDRRSDLVLLDLNLPDASDLDAVHGIQSVYDDGPVVVLTGLDDEDTALRALRQGVQDYLVKDRMNPDTLRRVIRYSLERYRTARELDHARQATSRLTAILEATPDCVAVTDPEGRIQWLNASGRALAGLSDDVDIVDEPLASLQPDWAEKTLREEGMTRALDEGVWRGETALLTREGREIPVSQILLAHPGEDGTVEYFSTIMRDVSESKEREEQLRRSEERLERVLETMVEGLCITDAEGRIQFVNEGAEEILDMPAEELVDRLATDEALSRGRWRRHGHDGDVRAEEEMAVHQALTTGEAVHGVEHLLKRPDKETKAISVNAAPLRGPAGETEGVVLSLRDVTQQRRLEAELEQKALHDPLTGLPNRFLFVDRLEQAAARSSREEDQFAILFVDLDRFKEVNDSLGHAAGDQVLRRVAERIRGSFREEDTVARIGGDEFTVLLEGFEGKEGLQAAVDRLMESLDPPHHIQGQEFHVPASVGVVFSDPGEDPDQLIRQADKAMYRAKEGGGAGHHIFAPGDDAGDAYRLQRESRLEEGIREEEFTLHYLPLIDLTTSEVWGVEALARWQHPERGLLMAGEFIDLAEESGLIVELGRQLLREATRTALRWQEDGPTTLFFNVSARQFDWPELVPAVSEILGETGLPPDRLCLEVTERIIMRAADRLPAVKELGVEVYVDDFGMGYSSLSSLRRLPVDGLKIDRSFTAGLDPGSADAGLVKTILTLGEALGLDVVAEGIEREDQRDRLLELGCRLGQGFLFGHPMDADALERWREERRA